jgi:hypothetical protein
MKEIILTQGKVAIVDDDDYEYLNQWKWCVRINKKDVYYATRSDYSIKGKTSCISMHRQIMNATKGYVVDHINQCTLDNRKVNLRICTHTQNLHNRPKNINNTSGYKGVGWCNKYEKWRAKIWLNSKCYHVGYYIDVIDAARAYNAAALKYHGEFAHLNKIDEL